MGSTLTARISDELAAEIARISEEEHLDKSAVARRLLEDAVQRHRVDRAVERYAQGEVTLRGAAAHARLTLREFMDLLSERDVTFHYRIEDLEEDFRAVAEGG